MDVEGWSINGPKDPQLVGPDWTPSDPVGIDGVDARPIVNVLTDDGYLTEIWRSEWGDGEVGIGQVFQRVIQPGAASGWHAHRDTTDRLFCAVGRVLIALFDGRSVSPTHRAVATFRVGAERPAVIVVPPGVWHAVRNIGTGPAVFLNVVDMAYDYEEPDHYRLPIDTPQIPFTV
jgi:dTDP-4-dehydrorhamnose 3,5-epimerase